MWLDRLAFQSGSELRTALGQRTPAVADLPALRYTEMIVTESMRLYPPAYGIGREATRPTEVAGHPLPAGGIVIIPTWVVHRDPRWFDAPEAFRPERWANDAARRLPRFTYFPFGGTVHRQHVRNDEGHPDPGRDHAALPPRAGAAPAGTPTPSITLRPEPGLHMRLELSDTSGWHGDR